MDIKKKTKLKLPQKRTINFVESLEKKASWFWAIPGVIIIVAGACVLSKYAVIDRYAKLSAAEGEVATLQSQVDALYEVYNSMGDIADSFSHYTYSTLTDGEVQYFNRMEVLNLIEKHIMTNAYVNNWQLKESTLIVPIEASSLDVVRHIVASLEEDPLVDFCTMTTAETRNESHNPKEIDLDYVAKATKALDVVNGTVQYPKEMLRGYVEEVAEETEENLEETTDTATGDENAENAEEVVEEPVEVVVAQITIYLNNLEGGEEE